MARERSRLIVGCMTGTSLDAIDAALVRVTGEGLAMRATLVGHASRRLGPLAAMLRPTVEQQPLAAGRFARMAQMLATLHVVVIRKLLAATRERVDFIAVHGQTVFHEPPLSWQLINAPLIAALVERPVVFDLRAADLALDGQGAPITPIADFVLFREASETRTVVNLGGFINTTRLPRTRREARAALALVSAGDLCVCNQLLDAVARTALDEPMDRGGRAALRGRVLTEPLEALLAMLARQAAKGRSLGTGDEAFDWVDRHAARQDGADVAATACHAIARTLADRVSGSDRVILAGGGVRNRALREAISALVSGVQLSDSLGVPASLREAMAMAVLGALCDDGIPITLPQVTGCRRAPVAGCWTHR